MHALLLSFALLAADDPLRVLPVALIEKPFDRVTLRGGIKSWLDVVRNPMLPHQTSNIVHGALLDYDLPDLVNSLPPGTVVIEDPLK